MQMTNCSLVRCVLGNFAMQMVVNWEEACWLEALGEVSEVVGLTHEGLHSNLNNWNICSGFFAGIGIWTTKLFC